MMMVMEETGMEEAGMEETGMEETGMEEAGMEEAGVEEANSGGHVVDMAVLEAVEAAVAVRTKCQRHYCG